MKKINSLIILIFISLTMIHCNNNDVGPQQQNCNIEPYTYSDAVYQVRIIRSEDYGYQKGFGYAIYKNQSEFKNQPNLPAVSGTRVFNCKEKAARLGNIVAERLASGGNLSVTAEEVEDVDASNCPCANHQVQ